ncbi:MAG: hypothetical protein QG673_581 [Pseudomonadota bacterium]|nr:hypothetical protein [Pseudomonadota bacterium]
MDTYQNKWDTRSSIRTSPHKLIDFNLHGYFFPPDKQPLLFCPEIQALGEDTKGIVLLQSFYKYLEDIVNLESKSIISACNLIISAELSVKYDSNIRLNAYTVIIDEYYHIYMAKDIIYQLEQKFPEIPRLKYPVSDAYNAIQIIKKQLQPLYHNVFEIIAVCIFETTLIRELVSFFNSTEVHPSVRYYVNDHMNDESKHYYYFYNVLSITWNTLTPQYRDAIGKYLGDFIIHYLNVISDKQFNQALACQILVDENYAQALVERLYNGFKISSELPIVNNVLKVFEKVGLFQNNSVREGFQKYNLLKSM